MSDTTSSVSFDSDKKGIKRVVHIFQDIILPRSTPISTKQIHDHLISEGYNISRCQLNRILNSYSNDFGVDRVDDKDEFGSIYWLAKKSSSRMSEVEAMLYIAVTEHIGLETLISSLPKDTQEFLMQQLERTSTRVKTLKNVPHHRVHNFQKNTQLFCAYENKCRFEPGVLNSFRAALNNSLELKITSSELPPQTQDLFTPISLFEKEGNLYVTGLSELNGGTNANYSLSKITTANCIDPDSATCNRLRR
ncbi:hypothetical protein LMJ53_15570 [Rheinheimera sp. UJ51]|uniref:hypothetical protein n=1 Tax=unclassified Rheinheimera TaxID=115860 RepID=UPI001E457622|nr:MULTISPECIES: hypothetical protein [unclassified Rheinheimera]MCC5453139.1 hypothetical protein [Rheinheimera sp. UJ51]MCF4010642.1 hypothetical protein [Rheinheimera sp. UJ63]